MNAHNPRAFLSGTALSTVDPSTDAQLTALATEWLELTDEINSDRHDDDGPAQDRLSDRQTAIEKEMCSLAAEGRPGLRAKAQVLKALYLCEFDFPDGPNLDDRESIAVSISEDLLKTEPLPDPVFAAIVACRKALTFYGFELKVHPDGEHGDVRKAADAYNEAWQAVRDTQPTTLEGARALARYALDLSNQMGSFDYHEQALETLGAASVADLISEHQGAVMAMCEASTRVYDDPQDASEVAQAILTGAHEREEAAFRFVMSAKPSAPGDVALMIGVFKKRYEASMASPSDGLFDLLDGISAHIGVAQ